MDKINVLIVEDHPLTRFALKTSLRDEDFINEVFESPDAPIAYDILNKHKIDIVLMDLGLPGINGVKATLEVKRLHKDVKIIVITSHTEEKEVKKCLDAGINAYCTKDIKPEKLIELIKDIMSGSMWFDPAITEIVQNAVRARKGYDPEKTKTAKDYNLTEKEKQVLALIKIGNSNMEISNKLNIKVNTTKVHVCSILQKLGVDDRTQAAIKAINDNLPG